MDEEKRPLFNLKAVVRETGVAAATLRTWERRYGLPRPQRAPSGRRLYSQRDIETVRWLTLCQSRGMTIGQAVALWQSLTEAGKEPLLEVRRTAAEQSPLQGEALARCREAWVAACLAFDESAADAAFGQALALVPPEVACLEVLQKGLAEIGEAWYQGHATVHQEHFASALAALRVQTLLAIVPPVSRADPLLVVCPPGETHTFGPLLLTYLLRRAGWRAIYLGADLPVEEVEAAVRRAAPRWVIASACQLPPVVDVQALGLRLQGRVLLAFGGRIFNLLPALRSRIAGYFLGEGLNEAAARLEEWSARPPALPAIDPVSAEYRRAQALYLEQEWPIKTRVLSLLSAHPLTCDLPTWLPEYTFSHLRAALMLGDMELADAYVDWLRGLRDGFSLPAGWVGPFLEAYLGGIEQHMGGDGALLTGWLSRHIGGTSQDGDGGR